MEQSISNKMITSYERKTGRQRESNLELFRIITMLLNVAASTFGVLQIHANSDAMRTWLWQNLLRNVDVYDSRWLIVHAFGSIISVFAVCTVIDVVRRSIAGKMIRQQM